MSRVVLLFAVGGALLGSVVTADAQEAGPGSPWLDVFAGGERERYLRTLQVAGATATYPWGIRSFSPAEVRTIASARGDHPWATRWAATGPAGQARLLPMQAGFTFNSGFPHGRNDGPVWAGRGVTARASAGAAVDFSGLSLVVSPVVFWAQNARFPLWPNGLSGEGAFGDSFFPLSIDHPQRFGDKAYARLDWGQSTVRIDVAGLSAGLSSANQVWGPAVEYPLLLGVNAPGFAHVFIGTSRPRATPVGSFHGRIVWGALEQSPFAPLPELPRRLMTGWVVEYSPPGLPSLELGAGRFYHLPWPKEGERWESLRRPLDPFLAKDVQKRAVDDNQLFSLFGRWVFPATGLEVYGEFAREDYAYRLRDFLLEPDHTSAYLLGMAKVWNRENRAWWGARFELLNAARPQEVRIRYYAPMYLHHAIHQGHTHRGQVLGSPAAIGGGGASLSVDRYDDTGRWSGKVARELRYEGLSVEWSGKEYPRPLDVLYEASLERLLFRGPLELSFQIGAVYNLDRHFESDALNATASASAAFVP